MAEPNSGAPFRHPIDWQNPDFYDLEKIEAEMERVFDICHGCRRCFNLCESFPTLFDMIDATPTGELDGVPKEKYKAVVDDCTLCDMCFMAKCPYVPPHEFNLDFPHLMLRWRAYEFAKGIPSFADKELVETDRNGKIGAVLSPVMNWASTPTGDLRPDHGGRCGHRPPCRFAEIREPGHSCPAPPKSAPVQQTTARPGGRRYLRRQNLFRADPPHRSARPVLARLGAGRTAAWPRS